MLRSEGSSWNAGQSVIVTFLYCDWLPTCVHHSHCLCVSLSLTCRYFSVNPAGTTPTLDTGDKTIGDSGDIVRYLDQTYPSPSLDPPGNTEAEAVTGQVFSVFLAWVKNKEEGKAVEPRDKFVGELEKIDKFLGNGAGEEAQLMVSH